MTSARTGRWVPPWSLAVVAMCSVQLGSALSLHLIATIGPAGTAWVRLSFGGVIFLIVARPPLRSIRRRDLPVLVALGANTGIQTIAFLAAIARIPLGTCVAIEFLGPMTVAALQAHTRRAIAWPAIAAIGVALLTHPRNGRIHAAGIAFAAVAAAGWAGYILFTHAVGDRYPGITGLALTIPIAALTVAAIGVPQAAGHLTGPMLAAGLGLALLIPVIPYSLEMLAIRRMTPTAFGTLMALEPAIAVLLGLIILHQTPSTVQAAGTVLVVLAAAAARRTSPDRSAGSGAPVQQVPAAPAHNHPTATRSAP